MFTFSVVLTSQLGSDQVSPDQAIMPLDSVGLHGEIEDFEVR